MAYFKELTESEILQLKQRRFLQLNITPTLKHSQTKETNKKKPLTSI